MQAATFLLFALALTAPARADTLSVQIEELTSTELRDRVASGATTVLVPIGGHFVMNPKDAAMAVREMIKPKFALPIHYGTTPQLAGTAAEFKAALGTAPGTARMLVVDPGQKVDF